MSDNTGRKLSFANWAGVPILLVNQDVGPIFELWGAVAVYEVSR